MSVGVSVGRSVEDHLDTVDHVEVVSDGEGGEVEAARYAAVVRLQNRRVMYFSTEPTPALCAGNKTPVGT